jgi:hypothetical protein
MSGIKPCTALLKGEFRVLHKSITCGRTHRGFSSRRLLNLFLLALSAFLVLEGAAFSQSAGDLFQNALDAEKQGRLDEALEY